MTKVTIISGFLGAGKTTLIRKLLAEVFNGQKIVLIENEYGEIGIDGSFLKDSGVQITEMNSGCICCTLVGDFTAALKQVIADFAPDRIIIEPSGVGKLSDIVDAVERVKETEPELVITEKIAVVDAKKAKIYMKNFGEFFKNQVHHASTVVLSRTQMVSEDKLAETVALLRTENAEAPLITTPWDILSADAIRHALEHSDVESLIDDDDDDDECCCHHHHDGEEEHHHHHHHHDDEDEECCCHHHHDDDDDDHGEAHCHHHHDGEGHCHHHEEHEDDACEHLHHHEDEHCHHHHDEEGHCHHHEEHEDDECEHLHHHEDEHCHHHHDEDEECCCHHDHEHGHDHHGHHHHHADEIFTSWGRESSRKYSPEELADILKALMESEEYGTILRSKGIIPMTDGSWKQFDLVPEEDEIRDCAPDYTGRICVIGCELKEDKLAELFRL